MKIKSIELNDRIVMINTSQITVHEDRPADFHNHSGNTLDSFNQAEEQRVSNRTRIKEDNTIIFHINEIEKVLFEKFQKIDNEGDPDGDPKYKVTLLNEDGSRIFGANSSPEHNEFLRNMVKEHLIRQQQ